MGEGVEGVEGGHCECEGNRAGDRAGKGKSTPQRNLTRCGEAILSRQTSQEISSGNLRRGTPARAEISSPEIREENWERRGCIYVCARPCAFARANARVHRVCAKRQGYGGEYFGVSEGSEGEIPEID